MESRGEGGLAPQEKQLQPQGTLKSIFDFASSIARRGINFERRFYQSAGTVNSVGSAILVGITTPGPITRELSPDEQDIYIDLMLVTRNGKTLHTFEYDISRQKQGKKQTFSIERRVRKQVIPKEKAKGVRRNNEFVVLFPLSSIYFQSIEQRVESRRNSNRGDNTLEIPLGNVEIDELNLVLKEIKEHGYTIDMTKGYKKYMESGGYTLV